MKSNNDRSKTIIRKTTFLLKAQETQLEITRFTRVRQVFENFKILPARFRKFKILPPKFGIFKILPARFEIFIHLAGKIKKIPNLAARFGKFKILPARFGKIHDLATHHSLTRCSNSRRITHQLAGPYGTTVNIS